MPSYIKINDINTEDIAQEITREFLNIVGWNSFEEYTNNFPPRVTVRTFSLSPFINMFGPKMTEVIDQFKTSYGEAVSVSLNILKRPGYISPSIYNKQSDTEEHFKVAVVIPIHKTNIRWTWYNYTGEFTKDTLSELHDLVRYVPADMSSASADDFTLLDKAAVCNVGKLHSVAYLAEGTSAYLSILFTDQTKLLADLENQTLFG